MQEMRFNLPVKYGIMPIIREGKLCAYIACKCYVVEHTVKYLKNGTVDNYKVVYFYNNDFKNNFPIFRNEQCLNSVEMECVFDDFERAQRIARVKNNYIAYKVSGTDDIELFQKYYDIENMLENKSNEGNIISLDSYKKSLKK